MHDRVNYANDHQNSIAGRRVDLDAILAYRGRWTRLSGRLTPCHDPDSIWRFSRERAPGDPWQGWKVHLPATLWSACDLLESVGPFLERAGIRFKVPRSLDEVVKLNSGVCYGHGQTGKVLTIYPASDNEFRDVVLAVADLIAEDFPAPIVPFDLRFGDTPVHYRYGSFVRLADDLADTIEGPEGCRVTDRRDAPAEVPKWLRDPLAGVSPSPTRASSIPFPRRYIVSRALAQRGKGGVYLAFDTARPGGPKRCVIKEGRRHGETWWDGRDGRDRVLHEKEVLSNLGRSLPELPRVYDAFEADGNHYVAMEHIEGESLFARMALRRRRFPVAEVLRWGVQIADLLSRIHDRGWVWRDCKPENLILTRAGLLRPIDFEGAARIGSEDPYPWSTAAYSRSVNCDPGRVCGESQDIFALVVLLHYLLEGWRPFAEDGTPSRTLARNGNCGAGGRFSRRRDVPVELGQLIADVIDGGGEHGISASQLRSQLRTQLSAILARRSAKPGSPRSGSNNGSTFKATTAP